jgi:hypothetical protein
MYSLLGFSPELATVVVIVAGGALVGLGYIVPVLLTAIWVVVRKGLWPVPALPVLIPVALLWVGLPAVLGIGAIMKMDRITVLSSGLLFACTVLLTGRCGGAVPVRVSRDHTGWQERVKLHFWIIFIRQSAGGFQKKGNRPLDIAFPDAKIVPLRAYK